MKIKLIKSSFKTDSDFTEFDFDTVLEAVDTGFGGADVPVANLTAAGVEVDIEGSDITEEDGVKYFFFSSGGLGFFKQEYEVVG